MLMSASLLRPSRAPLVRGEEEEKESDERRKRSGICIIATRSESM